ncbi:hypothetical protein PR202_gb27017 [Eleusine coracana subsp. coracana]|uniref:Uncharacterized protein n=1 Tax=Eleusine coracana subsp. coracana TaxID=191504 RepID=A0AAV5FUR6_ELECO|nr:hypothetical protein QOZ80_1BG0051550 [Eleusine coracana subsp. coracana]GJN38011.1 hypothetical protein PR202_gb27017 [Eleusine coracana subsp. coracana]
MASPSMEAAHPPTTIRDLIIGRVDYYYDDTIAEEGEEEEEEDDDDEWDDMSKRMSRLSMEGSDGGDADDENDGGDVEEEDDEFDKARSDIDGATPYRPSVPSSASLPGTPDRATQAASQSSPWWPGPSSKEYASETEARWPPSGSGRRRHHHHHRRERMMREVWLERAWRMRKQRRQMMQGQVVGEVPVVVVGGGEASSSPSAAAARGGVAMDMEEVRACRDLGLDLPGDWTVEIPCYALSGVDTASSGGNSPASGSWRISSPGDDPNDVKARLKVWAQAVALASASRLGGS